MAAAVRRLKLSHSACRSSGKRLNRDFTDISLAFRRYGGKLELQACETAVMTSCTNQDTAVADMLSQIPAETESPVYEMRKVVVLHEDPSAREQALRKCEQLARGTNGPAPTVHWFSFALLQESGRAEDTLRLAAEADFVVFAMRSGSDFSPEVKIWIERWLARRRDREGALIGLIIDQPNRGWEVASKKEVYLRQIALRAGMDYLARLPGCVEKAMPNSIDSYNARAGQMTSVLDGILHAPLLPPPPF